MTAWQQTLADFVVVRGQALKRFAYLMCGDDAEADDLVQDALMRTLARGSAASLESYVRRAILNGYLDRRRARRTWLRYAPRLLVREEREDWTVDAIRRSEVHAALADLSPRQRACVVLHFYEDLSTAEIAGMLGCRAGTVRGYLSDALARLLPKFSDESRGGVCDGSKQ